ncbi:MAG: protein-glutamate O-methyltransferase CheR [Gemmataceae bacterium]|nr:protein-glutamate O-methyltransferase CheR [Gemmataceae bacterium]
MLHVKLGDRLDDLKLRSFVDYYYLLKYGSEAEWPKLAETLSVQETYFWREMDHVRAFVDLLLPQFVAAGHGPIRIWSAACATGEEPLTLAIALEEAGWFRRASIEIAATDMSAVAIEKARRGVYRERSFRAIPPELRAKYFVPAKGGWRIVDTVHQRVKWGLANLTIPGDFAPHAASPFVFCRNVFIYFSGATISKIVASFAEQMPKPSYLFVGASESLLRLTNLFELERIGGAFVYVKK